MGQAEISYYISHGILWKVVENDGYSFMRRGAETRQYALCLVDDAKPYYSRELEKAKEVKTEEIIDYAYPCMLAERSLKKSHDAVLAKDFDAAITYAMQAAAECRILTVALKEMKERENALRKQATSV